MRWVRSGKQRFASPQAREGDRLHPIGKRKSLGPGVQYGNAVQVQIAKGVADGRSEAGRVRAFDFDAAELSIMQQDQVDFGARVGWPEPGVVVPRG